MKILVVGIGYVGLSNAILLAEKHEVYAYDISKERVLQINNRQSPIEDKEIKEYFKTKRLNLEGIFSVESVCRKVDYIIISTPTNFDPEQNYFDTASVENVIGECLDKGTEACFVIKSTIPVGFTKRMRDKFNYKNIIFSPEFLREGRALYDNLYPSRIIVGADLKTKDYAQKFAELLREGAKKKNVPILLMASDEAEAVKLFANTYLALRVSYFNELDTYAETHGLNAKSIIEGVCLDPRIGEGYNNPSFGYGGYCLPKDTKQLLANYKDIPENLIRAVVDSNKTRKDYIAAQIMNKAGYPNKKDICIGIYRLAMKMNSDNFRQSAMLGIIKRLEKYHVQVIIYEPTINGSDYCGYRVIHDAKEFKEKSDLIVANRFGPELCGVEDKVYTRDIYQRD